MSNQIEVLGSLNPQKARQDKERVLSGGGVCPTLLARDYKDPLRILVKVKHEENKD